jgi:hypothetical protein
MPIVCTPTADLLRHQDQDLLISSVFGMPLQSLASFVPSHVQVPAGVATDKQIKVTFHIKLMSIFRPQDSAHIIRDFHFDFPADR